MRENLSCDSLRQQNCPWSFKNEVSNLLLLSEDFINKLVNAVRDQQVEVGDSMTLPDTVETVSSL